MLVIALILAIVGVFVKDAWNDIKTNGLSHYLFGLGVFLGFACLVYAKAAEDRPALNIAPAIAFTKDGRQSIMKIYKPALKEALRQERLASGFYESEEELDSIDARVEAVLKLAKPGSKYTFEEALIEMGYTPEEAKEIARDMGVSVQKAEMYGN